MFPIFNQVLRLPLLNSPPHPCDDEGDKIPVYVGQKCFDLDREGSLSKRLKKLSISQNAPAYTLDFKDVSILVSDRLFALDVCTLGDDQITFHHTKLFAAPNHLTSDPWLENSVYIVDTSWAVWEIHTTQNDKVETGARVFDIPEASEFQKSPGRVNVSLRFVDEQRAVLADGAGRLFLLDTGDRQQWQAWKIIQRDIVIEGASVFQVVDASSQKDGDGREVVEALLASVGDGEGDRARHKTVLTWITFTQDANGQLCESRRRCLEGSRPFDHASLERGGGGVTVACSRAFSLVADSVKEVVPEGSGDWEMVGRSPPGPIYTWNQSEDSVTLQLTLPADTQRPDIFVTVNSDTIDVGVKNSLTLLKGPLHSRVDAGTATWTVDEQRLEISLVKEAEGLWDMLVVGDNRGEMTMDEETITAIHDRLKHLTSDKWNPDPDCDTDNKPYNTQQLEAVDAFDEEECIYLMRIDGETHKISHQATISYNLLFNAQLSPDSAPALCLRHDVDGLLWQSQPVSGLTTAAGNAGCPWQHVGTLDAFGYVQASKTQRRFSSCAPDLSLAAIADHSRHVYLYRQWAPLTNALRNRRTSSDVKSTAKQHVVLLDPPDPVLGMHVTAATVFLLTAARIYAVKVAQDAL